MKQTINWTVVCTVPCTVLSAIALKALGMDSNAWSGGIGAGLGVVLGRWISAKRQISTDDS